MHFTLSQQPACGASSGTPRGPSGIKVTTNRDEVSCDQCKQSFEFKNGRSRKASDYGF